MRISCYVFALCVALSVAWAAETPSTPANPADTSVQPDAPPDEDEGGTIQARTSGRLSPGAAR